MEEVRQLVQEEGREARNLVAFHVAVDSPARVSRKPPRGLGGPVVKRTAPRPARRSASAGRDKRSELRARYWALLFGDLQRSIGEIYNTVEAHENLNECQEVILVLENYTRDFKALGEWFRLKWEYDNTPPPQRPQSLAWEIRKTDFVRPESRRTYSVKSSPSVSGKNSPCLSGHNTPSGKNSPNLTGKASPGSGKISPRISSGHSSTSPKANIEFFSSKIAASKVTAKPEPKLAKETSRLSDITEKDIKESNEELNSQNPPSPKEDVKPETKTTPTVELGKARESPNVSPKPVVIKSPKKTLANQVSAKLSHPQKSSTESNSAQANEIVSKLDAMENEFLTKQLSENKIKNDNMLNQDKDAETANLEINSNAVHTNEVVQNEIRKVTEEISIDVEELKEDSQTESESPTKSEDNFADISNGSSTKSADGKPLDSPENIEKNTELDEEKIDSVETTTEPLDIVKNVESTEEKNNSLETAAKILEIVNNTESTEEKNNAVETDKEILESTKEDKTKDVNNKVIENNVEVKPNIPDQKDTLNNKTIKTTDQNGPVDIKDEKKETEKKDTKPLEPKTLARPAYSQAAAKPKSATAPKVEVRSKTVVDIKPPPPKPPPRQFLKKNQGNKCSYPFNLTTGRTSLFDSPATTTVNKNVLPKKPINKNIQMASGDAKPIQNKIDLKKRPPRPTSLKLDEKETKTENLNTDLEKYKDYNDYGSSDTAVTQIDMSRIESSESLKTLVPEELSMFDDVANSVEVLNVDNTKNDNEGWLTVKSRRLSRESKKQSKSHWAQRFHQPSATTSLPTLNMIESPKQETKPITESPKSAKLDRAKSEQPQMVNQPEIKPKLEQPRVIKELEKITKAEQPHISKQQEKKVDSEQPIAVSKPEKVVKVSENIKRETKAKDPSMIRQKSDVTGLKTRSSKSEAYSKRIEQSSDDKSKDDETSDLTKNRLHSSLESLTTGLARSQESTEEAFDFDKWKTEFRSIFKYLDDDDQMLNHTDILETADPSERSEIAEMTSQIEENEKKLGWALDFQSEVDQRKLCEEEDLLNRQIMELQQVSDIDLDTETDDTETDAEILCDEAIGRVELITGGTLSASLEDRYETALAGMSWAERVDTLGALEALVSRDPGRAQQLHAKLSQGIRRRGSLQDALRRLQAKQVRAERQRMEYQTERSKKIHQLLAKVEEVKVAKNQLIEEKRLRMEKRLQKAAENRDQHLKDIVRKAHDEEEKLREIAFIKQLEAENRRHDFLDQCRSHTTRLRQMRRERLNKLEQKAAREAAVGARRLQLEEQRQKRVEALVERRKQRDARRDTLDQLRRHERHQAAKEKAEGVKSRLSALAAAAELEADALRSRIRDKQDASQQRLESHLQAIRERATNGPRQATTSESQDQGTKEEKLSAEQERIEQERKERERQKAVKKKARRVKEKLIATRYFSGTDYYLFDNITIPFEPLQLPGASRLHRVIQTLSNLIAPLQVGEPAEEEEHRNFLQLRQRQMQSQQPQNQQQQQSQQQQQNQQQRQNQQNQQNQQRRNQNQQQQQNQTQQRQTQQQPLQENRPTNPVVNGNATATESKKKKKKKSVPTGKPEDPPKENVPVENNNNTVVNNEMGECSHNGNNNVASKKKKKPKLNKANSVCSSVSDMSRGSNAREAPVVPIVDVPMIERQLNELSRLMEKFDKDLSDKMVYQKVQGLKLLGQLIAVVAEKHELAVQFPPRILTTTVMVISRVASACNVSAAYLITTNICVHLTQLLSEILEKDMTEYRNLEFAKQLSDCLAIAMDSVLCSSRVFEENKTAAGIDVNALKPQHSLMRVGQLAPEVDTEDSHILSLLRGRAHALISFICLSGCVAEPEKAGDARDSIQVLLTVCADVCRPCVVDEGPERLAATQSLRCALGTRIYGARADFCGLFARGAQLGEREGSTHFVRAARTAHLLRAIAEMDHHILQKAFGEAGWPLEFRAAVSRLLSQHAPSDREAPRNTAVRTCAPRLDQSLSETMVLDLIVLVGFMVVNNPQLQETILEGWSIVKTLCTLPANWLVSKTHSTALLPTLAALAARPTVRAAIASELSMKMIEEYMESPEAQMLKLVQVIKQAKTKKPGKK